MHSFKLFETNVGIKSINGKSFRVPCKTIGGELVTLSSEDLFMGPDLLKDEYTLLGCNIKESPHYSLMDDLLHNRDIAKSIYIKRRKEGTIDSRIGIKENSSLSIYKERFSKRYKEVVEQKYAPVCIYKVAEKYYIFDGKHRAALCAALGMPVRCMDISLIYYPAFPFMHLCAWKKDDIKYSKHISFYKDYCCQYYK